MSALADRLQGGEVERRAKPRCSANRLQIRIGRRGGDDVAAGIHQLERIEPWIEGMLHGSPVCSSWADRLARQLREVCLGPPDPVAEPRGCGDGI